MDQIKVESWQVQVEAWQIQVQVKIVKEKEEIKIQDEEKPQIKIKIQGKAGEKVQIQVKEIRYQDKKRENEIQDPATQKRRAIASASKAITTPSVWTRIQRGLSSSGGCCEPVGRTEEVGQLGQEVGEAEDCHLLLHQPGHQEAG